MAYSDLNALSALIKIQFLMLLCVFSTTANAFSESLQNLEPQVVNGIAGSVLALIFVLVVLIFIFKSRISKKDNLLTESEQQQNLLTEQLDRFITGVIQLDSSGNILYANRLALYYFEKKVEQLVGSEFVNVCPESIREGVSLGLAQTKEHHFQVQLGHYQRHARVRISPQKNPVGEIATFVSIEDVDSYQLKIDRHIAINEHLQQTMDYAKINCGSLNFESDTITLNTPLHQLLGANSERKYSSEEFTQFLENQNRAEWKIFVKQLGEGQPHSFNAVLLVNERRIPVKIDGMPHGTADDKDIVHATLIFENLTEIVKAKEQASLVQTQLKTVMNASPLPVYLLNGNKQFVDCNQAFCTLFKVDPIRLRNKRIDEIEMFDDEFKGMHSSLEGIGIKRKSGVITLHNEQQLDLNLQFLSYKMANNQTGTVAFIEDLSTLKALEQEVASCNATLNSLIDNSPLGIAVFDHEDKFVSVNSTLSDLVGKTQEEFLEQTFFQLFHSPEQAGTAARLLHQTGLIENFKATLVSKDNSHFLSRLDVTKLAGQEPRYICWVEDARELEYSHHRFQRLVTYSDTAVAMLGADGFTQLNPSACAFFGIENEQEMLGLSPASESLNIDKARAQEMEGHLDKVKTEGKVTGFAWEHRCNAEVLPCAVTLVPLFEQNIHVATLCMWSDMREIEQAHADRLEAINLRQMAEREVAEKKELLQSSQDLLASRARSLQDTQEKLAAAESDLASKLDTIQDLRQAHEDISGNLQLLQEDYERNRTLLKQSQEENADLESQLEESGEKVSLLQKQRNQIADALQNSERSHKKAQEELAISEQTSRRLKEEQALQQSSLEEAQGQINTLKGSIESKDKQINDVSSKISSLQSQLVSSGKVSEQLREKLINQRKASDLAETKRRELELICQAAQAELSNKSSYVEHLQHEMHMLEQMSQQQKGDMEKQKQQLAEELKAKQVQLESSEQQLVKARQLSEQEKQQGAAREAELLQLQQELKDVEKRSEEQQQQISAADARWKEQQATLHQELKDKQRELQETTERLNSAQQQTEEEKAHQGELVKKLEAELKDVEQRAAEQDKKVAQSDQQWQEQQQTLADELAAKKAQLNTTQQQLDEHKQQVEAEKLERKAQQDKLEQLKQEMADVESRAAKQREMMEGSDEQWRQHHAEIEEQKQALQLALEEARSQNKVMQSTLEDKLASLKNAESTVSKTQSDEQKLQRELSESKEQADALKARLTQQEEQETKLRQQVTEQQNSLIQREDSILALQKEQQRLTEALASVKQEYAQSKAALDKQNNSQQDLADQLSNLETELLTSKQQLVDKESALEAAQKQITDSETKLAAHEQALIEAQKEELKHANEEQQDKPSRPVPEFANLPMPAEPAVWFDLLPYLQQKQGVTSMASSLQELIDKLHASLIALDEAIEQNKEADIHLSCRKLITVLDTIHSVPINDIARRLQMCLENRLVDNIAISWPPTKKSMMTTLRVIYSHLHAQNE